MLRILYGVVIAQLIFWGTVGLLVGALYLPPVKRAVGQKVAEVASQKAGFPIQVTAALPGLRSIKLEGVSIALEGEELVSFQNLSLYPNMQALLEGHIRLASAVGDGFVIKVPDDPLALLKKRSEAAQVGATEASVEPTEGDSDPLSMRDRLLQKAARLLDPGGFNLRLGQGAVYWPDDAAGEPGVSLSHVLLSWPKPGKLPIRAGVGSGLPDGSGALDVDVSVSEDGDTITLRANGPGMPLERLRPRLEALAPVDLLEKMAPLLERVPRYPSIGGDFTVTATLSEKRVQLEGDVVVSDLYIDEPRLALVPFGPIELAQNVKLAVDASPLKLDIERWQGRLNKAAYGLTLKLEVGETPVVKRFPWERHGEGAGENGEGGWRSHESKNEGPPVATHFRIDMTNVPYQDLLDSVPPDLVPALKGVKLGGTFDGWFKADGNLREAQAMDADYNVDFSRLSLQVPSEPLRGDEPLKGYVYRPVNKEGVMREFVLGRDQAGWVTIDQIPNHLVNALLLSEDSDFFQHKGFDTDGLIYALKTNLKAGKPLRGGSTITQQLAKNLFLTRERTAVRKMQEAVLTFELEQVLNKRRILEHYFNIIEWGPGIYGVGRASQHYFGKHPSELSIKESAWLCTIIPNPVRYYGFYDRAELSVYWGHHIQHLIDRMRSFQRISEEEYQLASAETLYFYTQGGYRPVVDLSKLVMEETVGPMEEGAEEAPEEGEGEEAPIFSLPQLRFTNEPTP